MKFENNDFINLDYSTIQDEVKENIRQETRLKKAKKALTFGFSFKKALSYALCIMLTCIVSVGSTLLIQGSMLNGGNTIDEGNVGDPNPFKFCGDYSLWSDRFDEFYFFSGSIREKVNVDTILKSNLISEADKIKLNEYCEKYKVVKGDDRYFDKYHRKFNIYMGVKDNKEIIILDDLYKPFQEFVFESNLSYSYKSVVEKFESLSGETLTQEFLKASVSYEDYNYRNGERIFFNYEVGGITMRFVQGVSNGFAEEYFVEYYTAIINDQIYIVPCTQLLDGYTQFIPAK